MSCKLLDVLNSVVEIFLVEGYGSLELASDPHDSTFKTYDDEVTALREIQE